MQTVRDLDSLPITMSLKEGAEAFNVSYYFVRNLYLNGEIKGRRSGAKIYIFTPSLIQYFESGGSVAED